MSSKFWSSSAGKDLLGEDGNFDIRIPRKKWKRREALGDTRFLTNDVTVKSAMDELMESKYVLTEEDVHGK